MRIALHHRLGVGEAHFAQHCDGAGARPGRIGLAVQQRHFDQLAADGHHRIQARHRVLVDHGEAVAAQGSELGRSHGGDVAALEQDAAVGNGEAASEIAHDGERHRRLAATGFADETHRLAGRDREADIVEDAAHPLPPAGFDSQAIEGQDRLHGITHPDRTP